MSHDKEGTTVSYLEYFDVSQPERVAALLERAMKARRWAGGWSGWVLDGLVIVA